MTIGSGIAVAAFVVGFVALAIWAPGVLLIMLILIGFFFVFSA